MDSSSSSTTTIVHVYNTYLIDLVLNHPTLKRTTTTLIVKAIDPTSAVHIDNAKRTFDKDAFVALDANDALSDARIQSFEPMTGVSVATLCKTDNISSIRRALTSYVYILATLCATYCECETGGDAALTSTILRVLSRIQNGQTSDDELNGSMIDDIVTLLEKVSELSLDADSEADNTTPEGDRKIDESVLKSFENSKIADLAKEISTVIDMSKLSEGMDNPMNMLNFSNLTDSNSVLGSIVDKVGTKIQSKLATGELKHDELLSEAVNLLKAFDVNGANPLLGGAGGKGMKGMADVLKSMSDGGGNGGAKSAAARSRLREKLAKKQAAASQ